MPKPKDQRTALEKMRATYGNDVCFSGPMDMHTGRSAAPVTRAPSKPAPTFRPKAKARPFNPKRPEGKHRCPGCGRATLDGELVAGRGRCLDCRCP